ncbi:MAG: recombinase family protein [Desulfomonilaceae bacterium]
MRAYGYIRVSSVEQIKGTSLNEQKRQIEAYASLKQIDLLGVIIDPAIKGEIPIHLRPQGKLLVEAIDNGAIDTVIICKLDRAFRSASDCLTMVETWEKKGIGLHILNISGQTVDTTSPMGKFFITMMAGAAELEKNLIKERCSNGREARKLEGKVIGGLPYGYALDVDGKTLVKDASEQEALSLIRELKGQGRSLREIASELNARGYQAKKGGKWTHGQVQSVLKRAA